MQLSLFVADALQAIGAVMDVRWVGAGQVNAGQFCSAQGEFSTCVPTQASPPYRRLRDYFTAG